MSNFHEVIVRKGLNYLVLTGFVDTEAIGNFYYASSPAFDKILDSKNLAGAVTEHEEGYPMVMILSKLKSNVLLEIISHEVIHLAQYFKGDYKPSINKTFWKGKEYRALEASDENYFNPKYQPWETQARKLENDVLEWYMSDIGLDSMEKTILGINV